MYEAPPIISKLEEQMTADDKEEAYKKDEND
jgi:hypothetical protein